MRKTDLILQHLSSTGDAQTTSAIAAAIDDADGASRVSALLTYLSGLGRVEKGDQIGRENAWSITAAGAQWLNDLIEEAGGENVSRATRTIVAERTRTKAKVQRKTAKVQRATAKAPPVPALQVEPTPLAPLNGRAIAVREDGAVLVIEDGVVLTTLVPDDARRIALVVNRLMGAA